MWHNGDRYRSKLYTSRAYRILRIRNYDKKYIYLGTELNKSLDLIQLRMTRINISVPLVHRSMLIKNILISQCTCGVEISGLCDKRIIPSKRYSITHLNMFLNVATVFSSNTNP